MKSGPLTEEDTIVVRTTLEIRGRVIEIDARRYQATPTGFAAIAKSLAPSAGMCAPKSFADLAEILELEVSP